MSSCSARCSCWFTPPPAPTPPTASPPTATRSRRSSSTPSTANSSSRVAATSASASPLFPLLLRHGFVRDTTASDVACESCVEISLLVQRSRQSVPRRRMWALLQLHAKQCQETNCPVPRCRELREMRRRQVRSSALFFVHHASLCRAPSSFGGP